MIEEDISKAVDKKKVVSQIICPNNFDVKVSVEGTLNEEGLLCIKMSGICQEADVTIHDELLRYDVLFGICKVMFAKGVVPISTPLQLIKSFEDFCRICIFPFMAFVDGTYSEEDDAGASLMEASVSELTQHDDLGPNQWAIELWGLSPGIMDDVCITFLGLQCDVSLHYIEETSFRVAITSVIEMKTNSIFIELEYDRATFDEKFEFYKAEDFKCGGKAIPRQPGEIMLNSLKNLPSKFVEDIKDGLAEFENYLK